MTMPPMLDSAPITFIVIIAALMVTPFYTLATYAFSGASLRRGAVIGAVFLAWGAVMAWVCLSGLALRLGLAGQALVPLCWITPTAILLLNRRWFTAHALSQRWLVGLQVWRAIGGAFLLEMSRGNLPGVFAYPAGVGDLIVAGAALLALRASRGGSGVPRPWVVAVLVLGMLDFASAFFFGFTSNEGPQQLFFPEVPNRVLAFPTGMVPMFLVPCAIFFHALSWLKLRGEVAARTSTVDTLVR